MNEPSSALRAAAIERAARAIEADKLQVIDRDWQSGEHRLDLAATPGAGILAAVEVRAPRASARPSGWPGRHGGSTRRSPAMSCFAGSCPAAAGGSPSSARPAWAW